MKKTFYKIVGCDLKSLMVDGPLCVQYKMGEFVSANVKGLPLLVFDDFKTAREYHDDLSYGNLFEVEIVAWRGRTDHPRATIDQAFIHSSPKSLSEWLKRVNKDRRWWPDGTVFASKVKLVKEVNHEVRL